MSDYIDNRKKEIEGCESALWQLADCINQEIRENGPRTDQIFNVYTQDLRMFVKRLVDYCRADSKQRIEAAERQLSDLRAEVAEMNRCVELLAEWQSDRNKFAGSHRGGFATDVFCALNAIDAARSGK